MTQIKRTIKSIIQASAKLQVRLSLKAADASRFRENEYDNVWENKYPGLRVKTATYESFMWHEINENAPGGEGFVQAQFSRIRANHTLPRIGATCKRMLICQLPVKHMTTAIVCSKHGYSEENIDPVPSDHALTVGDLYERANQLVASYSCPNKLIVNDHCRVELVEFKSYDPVQYAIDMD